MTTYIKHNRTKIILSIILTLFLCLTMIFSVSMPTFAGEAKVLQQKSYAHLTDIHYYPLSYCYNGTDGNYQKQLLQSHKMLVEPSPTFTKVLADVLANPTDYMVITGDITKDGERQGHIEVANALRNLQNKVRLTKPNFQIFVINGNHDVYNGSASRFDINGTMQKADNISRKDFSIIYSSLGYPDIDDHTAKNFYITKELEVNKLLPYTPTGYSAFINSTTAPIFNIKYQFERHNDFWQLKDYEMGDLSYIVRENDSTTNLIAIDEEASNATDGHVIDGIISQETKNFIAVNKEKDALLVGIMHHSIVSHFEYEDSITSGFIVKEWKHSADFLAELGMRYAFTGHMHANDIATRISFKNEQITDMQTGAMLGYEGALRRVTITKLIDGGVYSEDVSTKLDIINNVDFSLPMSEGLFPSSYLKQGDLQKFMQGNVCVDLSKYSKKRTVDNLVDESIDGYLNINKILSLVDSFKNKIPSSLSKLLPMVDKIVVNLLNQTGDVILKDYLSANVTVDMVGSDRLFGYLKDRVAEILELPVNTYGTTFEQLVIECFSLYTSGLNTTIQNLDPKYKDGIANIRSGKVIKEVIGLLLDDKKGLYMLIEKLLVTELDLSKNMTAEEKSAITSLGSLLGYTSNSLDISKINLDVLGSKVIKFLNLGIDTDGGLKSYVDNVIDSFITDSVYTGLGAIAADVLQSFAVDSSFDGSSSKFTKIIVDNETHTYMDVKRKDVATVDNGKLPSMLTVTFGKDTTKDKNFVWFADTRITDGAILYSKDKTLKNPTQRNALSEIYATTYPLIDAGIFATMGSTEIGRHTVELEGLAPNTTYYYKVGSTSLGYFSPIYSFKTAPSDETTPFEVLLISDIQGFDQSSYNKVNTILSKVDSVFENGYDFVINAGDAVDNSANIEHYKYFLDTSSLVWGNTTQVVATGNHEDKFYENPKNFKPSSSEVNTSTYNYLLMHYNLAIPKQNTKTGAYYSFDYSGVHFAIVNTNDIVGNKLASSQLEWLTDDLSKSKSKHKVVVMHKGVYTAGAHSFDKDVVGLRKQLTPIFADNNVALVLQGHDHTYTESFYLDRDGKKVSARSTNGIVIGEEGKGTLYVNLGTLGDKRYKYVANEDVDINYGNELHNPTLANPTFGKLVFDGENLKYYGYQYDEINNIIKPINNADPLNLILAYLAVFALVGAIILVAVK